MAWLSGIDPATGLLDPAMSTAQASGLNAEFAVAKPFPHVAIDDFLPTPLLDRCLAEFPGEDQATDQFDRAQERRKRAFSPERLPPFSRQLFHSLNSHPFLRIVEAITGIPGLLPDPMFLGGGLHELATGGHLSVHADFNHHRSLNLERRVNVLIYLNKDWEESHGGQLELWDTRMTRCVKSYVPIFNRCVIFATTSDSYHGNPRPISHPDGRPRRSIALYYYTATWNDGLRSHTTQFQVRPGSADRPDLKVRLSEIVADLLPPVVTRNLRRRRTSERSR